MKKQQFPVMMVVTIVFAAFTLTIFFLRNHSVEEIQVTRIPAQTLVSSFDGEQPSPARLDLNAATLKELSELPGIGEVLAQRILDYRETAGGFRRVEELLNVEGIGNRKLEAILDYLFVGG